MEPRFLLDTHIAVRWVTEPKRLSREQLRALEAARRRNEPFVLSAMSLVEIALLTSAGKLRLKATLNDFFAQLQGSPEFTVLPLTYDIALEVAALDSHLRDPADRIIVATARVTPAAPGNLRSAHHRIETRDRRRLDATAFSTAPEIRRIPRAVDTAP